MNDAKIISQKKDVKQVLNSIWKALHNQTFLYILKRVLRSLLTTALIIAVVTALIRLTPEIKLYDVKQYSRILGGGSNPAKVAAAEKFRIAQLYLAGRYDKQRNKISVLENILQYIYWVLPIYKEIPFRWNNNGDVLDTWTGYIYFGRSVTTTKFVHVLFFKKIGISLKMALWALLFTYLIGYPLGIAMAKKPGGVIDKIGNVFIVLNYAIPSLVFYLFMCQLFGDPNGIFGSLDFGYFYDPERWQTLVPPIFCTVFLSIPGVIIYLRRFMIDELTSDYVKFARSKGLSENRIMYTHVLRNAIVPLARNIPATFIFAIVGSYFVETIWGIDGTGKLLTNAISNSDMPLIQGLTVIYAIMSMVAFLLGDIITVFFDPRIKLQED